MIGLILSIICAVLGICLTIYANKQLAVATERLKRAKEREKRLNNELSKPPITYCAAINFDRSCVIVGAKYFGRGWFCDVNFKEYPFDPADIEDRAFAIREAEELIEKLKEK